ncbi:hypothetical protein GF386_03545 [Candidatus Pacearchaeota archaeon]|nr:hypothetical protein [Candidatus Pacearchaeota archaeon]MBD3283225.1 hypothetical protein [Candidatus Pacearchaeota archaeon]
MEKRVLYPYGNLDVLYYYSEVAPFLKEYMKNKQIATRTWIPESNIKYFIRRGSENPPLYSKDFKVSKKLMKLRVKGKLDEVRDKLNKKEELLWYYFVPRKYTELYYSVNGEKVGLPLERVYFDIDRKNLSADKARVIAMNLIDEIKQDRKFNKLVKYRIVVLWTGSSFHVVLLFMKKQKKDFYDRYISGENSFTKKWVDSINRRTKFIVNAGHEKEKNIIKVDSSQSPSGKLARAPFSLYIKNFRVDGVCVPVSIKELNNKNLIKKLKKLTPEKIIKNLKYYKKLL